MRLTRCVKTQHSRAQSPPLGPFATVETNSVAVVPPSRPVSGMISRYRPLIPLIEVPGKRSFLAMACDLWQSIAHGKQRRSKPRKEKAQKAGATKGAPASGLLRKQATGPETLVGVNRQRPRRTLISLLAPEATVQAFADFFSGQPTPVSGPGRRSRCLTSSLGTVTLSWKCLFRKKLSLNAAADRDSWQTLLFRSQARKPSPWKRFPWSWC